MRVRRGTSANRRHDNGPSSRPAHLGRRRSGLAARRRRRRAVRAVFATRIVDLRRLHGHVRGADIDLGSMQIDLRRGDTHRRRVDIDRRTLDIDAAGGDINRAAVNADTGALDANVTPSRGGAIEDSLLVAQAAVFRTVVRLVGAIPNHLRPVIAVPVLRASAASGHQKRTHASDQYIFQGNPQMETRSFSRQRADLWKTMACKGRSLTVETSLTIWQAAAPLGPGQAARPHTRVV